MELLIYMGLVSIFLFVLTDLLLSVLNVSSESKTTSSVEQDGRFIMARMMHDIPKVQSSTGLISPLIGATAPELQFSASGSSFRYFLDAEGNLKLEIDGVSENLNGYNTQISNLSFTHLGNSSDPGVTSPKDSIKIQYTVTSRSLRNSGKEIQTFKSTVGIR